MIEARTKRQEIDALKQKNKELEANYHALCDRVTKLEAARVAAAKEAKKPTKKAK